MLAMLRQFPIMVNQFICRKDANRLFNERIALFMERCFDQNVSLLVILVFYELRESG